ncbi:PCNT-like protein [Mya arenaria]|uniref:PCNT-like protein n=1 Tax=Mya arenaria TaxID=6604 RepID=A0ABY7DCS4_MYAAR|nr:PCNT-like protein [Mya arenaria]
MNNSEPIIAGKEESAEFITQLNRKLTEEHRQIIQQIEADLELRGRSKDGQTDREDTVSVTSEPVTSAEKKAVLNKAEDVQRSLAAQVEEIESLRARMLNEYQQMLSVRAEVMSSQSAEVEQLQREMETIQRDYAGQMDEFETKVKQQTESAVRSELGSSHARDLEEMKTYYEAKEHAELLSRLQQENGGSDLPSTVHMSPGKHRDYVRHTTTLTAISDEDESPPSTPTPGTTPTGGGDDGMIENRLRTLESKLKDKEKIIDQLKKRVEAETTSAEDLHGKLLDSNKTLEDMEESLKSRADEIEDLKKELAEKVEKIIDLESEKAALEEKGEKDTGVSESGDKILAELRERIKTLENELSASKETNAKIKDEINKMSYEHGEAIVKMKEEMENLNIIKIEELEAGFKIQLEEELQQQAEELDNKMQDELRQQAEELNVFKQTESELKQKLDEIQTEHEKQLNELKEKYESESQGVVEPTIEVQETMEVQMVSPTETMDRESLEATLREELKAEILKEYEDSIDSLKNEYEERISDLNTKLQSLETKEKIESSESEDESDIKEKLRVEIAQEFKDKLQNVTDEYETKLKHLQGILDSKKESERKENEATTKQLTQSSPPYVLARSRSLDRMPSQDRSKLPADYEGFVSTIRKGYEDRINSLQREIAQYKSSVGPVPLSPLLSLTSKAQVVSSSTTDSDRTKALKASPDSVTGSSVAVSPQLRQQVYDEIHAEFQASYDQLKEDYEAQLEELTDKLNALQSDSATQGDIENKISEEYEEQIEKLKAEYGEKIAILKLEHEEEVSKLNTELEKSKSDKLAAEKKVKADMFVWHEESRLGEEKDLEIEEQRAKYEAQMVELRESLLQQYQAQLAEAESSNQAAIQALQDNLEAAELAQGVSESASEKKDTEKDTGVDSGEYLSDLKRTHEIGLGSQGEAVRSTASIDSTKMDEGEKDEEEEDVDTTGAGGRYRDGDDDTDGGAGGAKVTPNSTQDNKDLQVEQHDISHEQDGDQPDTTTGEAVGDTVAELRQQLEKKHAEEIRQLTEELSALEGQHMEEEAKLQHSHEVMIATLNEEIENLREGEATEALELAHQQELSDLENRLVHKHMNELNNAQTQYQSKLDSLHKAHAFHGEITEGQDEEDFMARESLSSTDSEPKSEPFQAHQPSDTIETQAFEAQAEEEITESSDIGGASLGGTLEGIGVVSLDTSVDPATLADTSLDQSRGTLRGVDTTADTELIHFSEEEEEDEETSETDRSMQDELQPTVKSLDDTTDSSLRGTDREELQARLEAEVIDLRARLGAELERQGDTLERIDREKQEERNLTAMLREDIERLNGDREAMQTTNEHLLSLLSDSVKTYMTVDEGITRRMKTMMEKSGVKVPAPGSGKRTPPPGKKSPSASPGRLSPARAEDADNLQETSILSNITDEGLDLSQRICDSIFQGPDLASEEEELLIDSGSRLRTSVTHLLEVLEETTSQLLDTRSTQAQLADTVEGTGHDLSSLMARCADLEDRLREEVERKDFLALELHKAEGLIEGYVSERETLELKIGDLEEQKETLVLSLETTKNKLHDLESMKSENEKLRQEMKEQRELMTSNVGDEAQALLLEVDRLNSENREREEQVRTTHERYEYRVRELETSGEDMEHHYGKLLDDKKQEVADLRLQEQSAEREQEHEEYQREIEKWRKNVHDLEKHNGSESRLQTDVDELTEQLQARIDLHETAIQESDRLQKSLKERDLSVRELKTLNEQFDLDLQEKSLEVERLKEKLAKLEATFGTGDFQDDELTDSGKSEARPQGPADSIELSGIEGRNERSGPHMTVEEEIRQAADKTKEELVREKFTLQCAVNDNLVQLSSLRNQLDEMRHRRGIGEPTDSEKRLDAEREKSEEKDKQISELNLEIEELKETLGNRDQQIEQLREQRARHRTSPTESVLEYERDRDTERQLEALNRENKQLKERLKLAEASFAGDMSGLSQGLIEEKNAEIDQLSDQLSRLQADLADIKAERGVEHLASIAQEMEETVTARVAAGLEAEVQSLKSQVQTKEDLAVSLETELAALKEELAALKEELATLKEDEGLDLEEASHMQASIAEKEGMIGQLTAEVESMQIEITDLHDFQIKHEVEIARLKRDLREKDNVVEEKLEELAELSDKHIAKYKEQVKDNDEQILEKDKEIKKLRREIEIASEDEKSRIIQEQKEELENLKEQVQKLLGRPPSPPKSEDEIDDAVTLGRPPSPPGENFTESKADVITRLRVEIEKLKQQIMDANLTGDDKFVLIRDLRLENETLRKQIDAALKIRPPSPPMEEDEKTQLIHEQRREIEVLRTQVETGVPRTEDEASQVIRKQEKEIVKLKKQVEAALQIAPPLPPMSEDEKDNVIEEKEMEVQTLKKELSEVKLRLDSLNSSSATSLQESVQEKEVEMSKKEKKLKEAEERVKKLEEALEDAKEVKAYEDEIELKEKQDEIEELQAELETYRSREESSLSQSLEMDKTGEKSDPKQLVRSMSFYKEQYEDKCSETRQLQVQIDLIKQQLENANSEKLEDAQEEVELFRAENEQLRAKTEIFEKEREELKRELTFTRERQGKTDNEQIESLEKELQLTKDELARERLDTVEAINDLEHLRERKERERRGSLKTIQELEQDLEEKMAKEKQLNIQIKQLNEELTVIKRQYGIEDKGTGAEARTSPKSLQLRSQGSFELSNDVEILQEQVIQFKQHADKAKEILGEKQKYQSQLVKLEIQHEQLQKTMKKEVSRLEEQLKSFKTQPDKDVWTQLHATQDRLEKTSDQLAETGLHLAETESSLKQVSADLAAREDEMRGLQQDLWKTSSQLSATSTKLQETEERLRQALGQVSEREDQILHLQGEVQHPPAEQSSNISPQEVERLQDQLRSRDQELEQTTQEADRLRAQLADTKKELDEVGKSLREAVDMGEQQMSVAESKDQEFVQLKLDIQASMQEKDKLIREQKNQLKEKEKEMKKLQQDVEQRQKEVIKVTEEANKAKEEVAQTRQSGETTTIATLRAQLQNQEEVIISLETNLNEARTAVQERDTEISDIHHLASETRSQEAETVSAMHSQITNLQREVEELRALTKLKKFSSEGSETGQSPRSGGSQGRRPSPTDGADFRSSPDVSLLPGDATRRASDESFRTEGQTFLEAVQTMQDQEDSGHQSFEPSGTRERSLLRSESPEGQSLSPRQLRPQEVEILQREVVPAYMAASPSPPTRDGPEYQMVTQTSEARSRSSSKSSSPVDAEQQNGRTPSEGHSELDAQRSEDERSKQKVMSLKDELSSEHQRHISELTRRASQDTEAQLAALRIKYTDEIEHLKRLHGREVDEKLHDQLQKLERKYKAETNRLVVKHQEEITALKSRAGLDFDESSVHEREARQRQDGVGAEMGLVNGHGAEPMSAKLQGILRKLHREGVQVLTISELEYLNRSQSSASLPRDADVESLRAGWENERQSMISTIQALKDLLAQTHKLRGLDKSLEGSDWRAELLRAISYVFTKERETLLAQLRSHVLAFPETNIDEVQRLEQKIRNMESQHQSAQEQIFSADRQSLLAELRDLRAHATIARLQQQEERDRLHEKLAHAEDNALKKERQLKRQVQLLEFKIQQEKVLQEDLRTSLDTERHNTSDLSGQLSREKVTNLDLQTAASTLQGQVAKLREGLEREQSRYELRSELQEERDRRCAAESQHEIDAVTVGNLQQEVDMTRRHQHAVEAELSAKVNRLQQALINEEQRQADTARALERERALIQQLQQSLDSEREAGRDRVSVSEVTLQLEAERASMENTRAALARETRAREDVEGERRMLKEHLGQERQLNEEIKHELDKVQFERLEAINSLQKERDLYARMKGERDALTEEVRTVRTRESEREHRREEERLQGRQSAREVDRDREESRIKLREQELEVQRLSKKASRLEDQLATSQEHELRAVRDLEKLRLEVDEHQSHHDNMVSAQTSPRRGEGIDSSMDLDTSEQREKMSVYRSQLESMCQSLHYLVLRCREQLNMASHSGSRSGESSDYNVLQRSLRDLLSEVKQLQELEGGFMTHPSSTVNERVLRHNEELTNYAMQRTNEVSDHQILSERADWAKERLSLQMALTSAEREIGLLQTDLRVERERRVAAGNTETKDTDKVKIQRLYGKFLRAESFRKALVYQKKYLLLLLGGFQDTEETTLALLSRMGAVDSRQRSSLRDNARPLTKFRGAVRVVIAIQRMRFLVKKWRRATRVGSEVVGGSVDQSNGYVPNAGSYSPPRNGHASRVTPGHARSSSSPPTHTAYRHMSPARTASPAIARTASPAREYNGTSDHHHARGPGKKTSWRQAWR